ncbi:MAG TPA: sigma-70 family RNA polymerase sigma factor [Candidatus Limnocylindria bacterium]|jgi:RNA polymerase sigma-70 factor (ECF subfamily)|nr:sigma-70 family RNA polymerase sigma factor [Candidatus Limnocylindria bacterium]
METAATPASDGRDLLGQARSGDSEAFGELCREHGPRLLRQATAMCGDTSAAEDLVQESLIEAWRCLSRFDGRCRFFTWLCSILIHRHRNSLRKRWPLPFSFLFGGEDAQAGDLLAHTADPAPHPGIQAEAAEQAARLMRGLNRLPPKQREVVYLRFYADDSLEGIAAAVGCSVGTVKSRLFNGLERLRHLKSVAERNEP